MIYRLKQLIKAIYPKVTHEEYQWLQETLSKDQYKLFCKQPLAEQRHSLDVFYEVAKHKNTLNPKDYQILTYAALFHDCGKSLVKIHLWQRIFIVLSARSPDFIRKKLTEGKNIFARTMMIYSSHPSWGKHLAAKAGFNDQIQRTIEFHHSPRSSLDKLLYEADRRQ